MIRHAAPSQQALLAPTTELAANSPTLPQFQLPDVRSDRDRHLAKLFRDICYLDACGECCASNAWFERQVGVVESTIKRLLNVLAECGLIEVEILHGSRRRIRPCVPINAVLQAGWKALCLAVLDRRKYPEELRRLAASVLRRIGVRRGPDLTKLGVSHEDNCAPRAPRNAPLFPFKESEARKATTGRESGSESKGYGVVVSPAEALEPLPEAVAMAVSAGLTTHSARRAVGEKPVSVVRAAIRAAKVYAASHEVRSLPALLVTAIRAEWLPPVPPSSFGSDRGERPQRVVAAPTIAAPLPQSRPLEADRRAVVWDGLSEELREALLAESLAAVLAGESDASRNQARKRGVAAMPVILYAKDLALERFGGR